MLFIYLHISINYVLVYYSLLSIRYVYVLYILCVMVFYWQLNSTYFNLGKSLIFVDV